jgi:GNAT superfamily N-acetyltransferase
MRFASEFGFYELNPFPGSNQIVVSNHAFIYPQYRGKGLGQLQHKERLAEAKKLGYNYILCTVNKSNMAEIHILQKNGWDYLSFFENVETDHTVSIYGKSL